MQGAYNIDIVKLFLGTYKPAILTIQEALEQAHFLSQIISGLLHK